MKRAFSVGQKADLENPEVPLYPFLFTRYVKQAGALSTTLLPSPGVRRNAGHDIRTPEPGLRFMKCRVKAGPLTARLRGAFTGIVIVRARCNVKRACGREFVQNLLALWLRTAQKLVHQPDSVRQSL